MLTMWATGTGGDFGNWDWHGHEDAHVDGDEDGEPQGVFHGGWKVQGKKRRDDYGLKAYGPRMATRKRDAGVAIAHCAGYNHEDAHGWRGEYVEAWNVI